MKEIKKHISFYVGVSDWRGLDELAMDGRKFKSEIVREILLPELRRRLAELRRDQEDPREQAPG